MRICVAIDGPAGAGKSTIAKIIGEQFNLRYINTGAMYRAVTIFALRQNIKHSEVSAICTLVDTLKMHFEGDKLFVNGEDVSLEITNPKISDIVSSYAAIPEMREKVVRLQRKMAEESNVIMDGRDIGTVVLKDANFKFYITASAETRAMRRYEELIKNEIKTEYNEVLKSILNRDYIDMNRETNPLIKASDAIEIDTSHSSIEEVVGILTAYISKYIEKVQNT